MAITPVFTGSGQSTGATPVGANPFGMDPQTMQLLQQLGQVGSIAGGAIAGGGSPQAGSQGWYRQAGAAQPSFGNANNLLLAILQMRAQEAAALGSPYTQGQQSTGMQPARYSLLYG